MYVALIVIIILALVPQLLFTALYSKWIPTWVKNPYGRLAQLGSWCHIILLSVYLFFLLFRVHFNRLTAEYILITAFVPLVIFGFLQLILLKRAVDASKAERAREEEADT